MKYYLLVLYDSVENSVFAGQTLAPFARAIPSNDRGLIVSFEDRKPRQDAIQLIQNYANIDHIIAHKTPFFGSVSLRYAAYQLNRIIKSYSITAIRARGPLAGWIVAHASRAQHMPITVQARGLAAEEYQYVQAQYHVLWQTIMAFRARQYASIERFVYGTYAHQSNVQISAVSNALAHYLRETFHTPAQKITIEANDIPARLQAATIDQWRTAMRETLHINQSAKVFVYNGSAHAWQCPELIITKFITEYTKNRDAFLLIITPNTKTFHDLCKKYALPLSSYRIITVAHDQIYRYLAAADIGMIFRKSHIINWVSRPTKVLEYRAVGLPIMHNHTIAMLTDSAKSESQ